MPLTPTRFRALFVLLTVLAASPGGRSATTIDVSNDAIRTNVSRFGIGLAQHNYYDSHQMMKELLFRNPGFEGLLFQSVVRLGPGGTADRVIEDAAFTQWPTGFWAGASYEIIWSSANAKGRTGTILNSVAPNRPNPPNDPAGSSQGTSYLFSDLDAARVPAEGDYMVLRKVHTGGTGGGAAFASWQVATGGGGSVASETTDLPPRPANLSPLLPWSRQCARLDASGAGQQAAISGQFDTLQGFVRLRGQLRLAFRAKGVGGANRLLVTVRRGSLAPYLEQTVQLTGDWADYTLPFARLLDEPATVSGTVSVSFSPVNQSAVLLDDVSLRQTDSDPANPTEFRDDVVTALAGLRPGILRYVNWQDVGNSLDNSLAPVPARMRSGYSAYATSEANMMPGLHEFLQLCEHLGAEPWYSMPVTFSTREVANLMEYLGGPVTTPYGAIRAALGRPAPWTGAFRRVHLEFGNENWNNSAYRGAAITAPVPCGNRASELFAVIKGSPYYSAGSFRCLLGGQASNTGLNLQLHNASTQHDSLNLAPYMSSRVDSFADNEQLFGPLFAEPEWWSFNPSPTSGLMRLNLNNLQASSRPVPLSIYEVNLHTNQGSISQAALDRYTPSVGAALAVMDHMLIMLRELNCREQVFFSLAGHRTAWTATDNTARSSALWGATIDMGKTNRKRPHYHALQLVNDVLAGDMVRTTHRGDDPTWNVSNQNRVTFNGAHYLQSFAFRQGTERALLVVNLHRTESLPVDFTGTNAPSGRVRLRRLTSSRITDHNEEADIVTVANATLDALDPAQPLSLPPFSLTVLQWSASSSSPNLPGPATPPPVVVTPPSSTPPPVTVIPPPTSSTPPPVTVTPPPSTPPSSTVNPLPVVPPATTPPPTPAASAPAITRQPQSQAVRVGEAVTLSVAASGSPAPTFQWRRNGTAIAGATSSTLTIGAVGATDAGTYDCVVTNVAGSAASAVATLAVRTGARLANLSIRTTIMPEQPLIIGLVVAGGSRDVLVRAVGPGLARFGVNGLIPNPRLSLAGENTAGGGITNDNWEQGGADASVFQRVGAFPLSPGSLDAAIARLFPAQTYTAAITDESGQAGVALVECYDAGGTGLGRLINLATRTRIAAAGEAVICGVSVSGEGSQSVLVRAIGPALRQFGVSGVLPAPRLVVFDSSGNAVAENTRWPSALAPLFAELGAFPLPANSADSAAVIQVEAGRSITVQIADTTGGVGEVLLEVYEIAPAIASPGSGT